MIASFLCRICAVLALRRAWRFRAILVRVPPADVLLHRGGVGRPGRVPRPAGGVEGQDVAGAHQARLLLPHQEQQLPAKRAQPGERKGRRVRPGGRGCSAEPKLGPARLVVTYSNVISLLT